MNNQIIKISGLLIFSFLFLQSCMADLRTKTIKQEGITIENTKKGKAVLDRSWKAQGFDKIKNHQVYSFKGKDTWKGMLGRVGKVWPNRKTEMNFKYEVGTFDGQVAFLDGKRKGEYAGLQNWNYYEIDDEDKAQFQKPNKRIKFGLAAYQYFTEMIDRLRSAPIINYAGEKEFKGKKYDLVFVTWNTEKPHQEADQYIAWINKETGLMDYTQYTLRESYLKAPGSKAIAGAVEYGDYREVDSILISFEHTVYGFNMKKRKKKNLHQLVISDFQFDDFDVEELRLNKSLAKGGDFKN
ncbi:MAG: hypothetical protein AB8H03_13620 [Saprospiraceae bacterium]